MPDIIKFLELLIILMKPTALSEIHNLNLVGGAFFKALNNAFGTVFGE